MQVTRKELLTSKGLIVVAFILVVYLGKKYAVPSVEVECIRDPVHESLQYFNDLVNKNIHTAQFLQISSSLLMDIVFISLYGYWVFNISTGRVIYATALFYLVRAITQGLVTLRFPEGYYWSDPNVPSIVVPYGRTSDFFYSGHCGFLNLCALEWLRQGKKDYFKVVQIINVYMAIVMLIFRIHYMIDITTAIFMSHYIFIIIEQRLEQLDQLSLKYYDILKMKILECQGGTNKIEDQSDNLLSPKSDRKSELPIYNTSK